jgi:hypothetical protein
MMKSVGSQNVLKPAMCILVNFMAQPSCCETDRSMSVGANCHHLSDGITKATEGFGLGRLRIGRKPRRECKRPSHFSCAQPTPSASWKPRPKLSSLESELSSTSLFEHRFCPKTDAHFWVRYSSFLF